jgi:NAD+ synthetase
VKTDEKFHYEFGHPYDLETGKITASSIGIRTQEFHSIHPVDAYERYYWKEAVADFMMGIRKSGSVPTCYERVDEVDMYKGDAEFFDFQKIRQDHYRTEPLDYKTVYDNIVTGLSSYVNKYHLESLILGISGGIDSTVIAALSKEVCKHTGCKLIGISLMTNTNQNDEVDAACLVGAEFCTEYQKCTIEEEYKVLDAMCDRINGEGNPTSRGNIKARMRMITLFDASAKNKGIVLSGANRTEIELGFSTLGGDSIAAIAPLAETWKHEVYELAKWMLKNIYIDSAALKASIALTPTDGNGVQAGGDMAQIAPGHTYEDVDDILMTYIEYKGHHPEEYQIAMNELYEKYTKETVDRVIERYHKSAFKRLHIPLGIDIFDACIVEANGKLVY